jgi:cell volume regulation protein A
VLIEQWMAVAAVLLLAGILASKLSSRLGIPALLLFLVIGMLAGSDGPGGIWFDNASLAQSLGVVALALILFAGGLQTNWEQVREVLWRGISLSTAGVLLTAALVAWFTSVVLGFSLLEGLLLGAIVSSTDAAAVFAVLRAQRKGLQGRLQPLLEFESGSNDPMAVFLTVAFTSLLAHAQTSAVALLPMFFQQMAVGALAGYLGGRLGLALVNRIQIDAEGLYPVMTLSLALLTYGVTARLGGSGFLAVYLAGLVMGRSDFIHKRSLVRFHDGLAWLMQIAMFLTLGLLVFPSRLPGVAGRAILVALFLMLVARPLSVFASLSFARLGMRPKLLVSWVGLRGAVPIILATFPLVAGLPEAEVYFNLVFFVVLTSVLVQGTTIPLAARWLRLEVPAPKKSSWPLEFAPATRTESELIEFTVREGSPGDNRKVLELRLPRSALAVLISRGDNYIVPRGGTVLMAGDEVLVLAEQSDIATVRALLEGGSQADAGNS